MLNPHLMKIQLARRIHFSSGHRYFNKNWSEEKNKEVFGLCYSEHGHGHNYILEVYITGPLNHETGMIMNLKEVDHILQQVSSSLDHKHLNNDLEEFKDKVPTTENIARYCFEKISEKLGPPPLQLNKVRLFESEDLWVDYGHLP